jgi:hypothetical protein
MEEKHFMEIILISARDPVPDGSPTVMATQQELGILSRPGPGDRPGSDAGRI